MKWMSSEFELPEHEEEVLIKTGEGYALAIFDLDKKAFVIQRDYRLAKISQMIVHWIRLTPPSRDVTSQKVV